MIRATTPVAPVTLTIDHDRVITALAFQDSRPMTAPKAVTVIRTTLPQEGLMTAVGPDLWARREDHHRPHGSRTKGGRSFRIGAGRSQVVCRS